MVLIEGRPRVHLKIASQGIEIHGHERLRNFIDRNVLKTCIGGNTG
jgi:hypothetical protein